MSIKNPNDTMGNRIRKRSACEGMSALPIKIQGVSKRALQL
jgi:hypothetical protein